MNKYVDIAERVVWTAVQGFAAAWLVLGDFTPATFKIAGTAAAIAAAKCLVAVNIGDSNSAAAIPGVEDTAPAKR